MESKLIPPRRVLPPSSAIKLVSTASCSTLGWWFEASRRCWDESRIGGRVEYLEAEAPETGAGLRPRYVCLNLRYLNPSGIIVATRSRDLSIVEMLRSCSSDG